MGKRRVDTAVAYVWTAIKGFIAIVRRPINR